MALTVYLLLVTRWGKEFLNILWTGSHDTRWFWCQQHNVERKIDENLRAGGHQVAVTIQLLTYPSLSKLETLLLARDSSQIAILNLTIDRYCQAEHRLLWKGTTKYTILWLQVRGWSFWFLVDITFTVTVNSIWCKMTGGKGEYFTRLSQVETNRVDSEPAWR